jgi:hypothetical protein
MESLNPQIHTALIFLLFIHLKLTLYINLQEYKQSIYQLPSDKPLPCTKL